MRFIVILAALQIYPKFEKKSNFVNEKRPLYKGRFSFVV
jgi:hypothetical protein